MKKGLIQLFLLIGLAVGSVVMTHAQSASQYRVHVPFEFTVGEKSFAAGDYSVTYGGLKSNQRQLILQSADGKESSLFVVMPKENTKRLNTSSLVFNLYEGTYSLAEVKTSQQSAEILSSKQAPRIAKNSKKVEVALTR